MLTEQIELVIEALEYHEIKHVVVTYSGSGDSGSIDNITAESIDDDVVIKQKDLEAILVPKASKLMPPRFSFEKNEAKPRDWPKNPPSLYELIEEAAYDLLEADHAGWEINAGAYGSIVFTAHAKHFGVLPVVVDFNENYEEYDGYEEEEYNDE